MSWLPGQTEIDIRNSPVITVSGVVLSLRYLSENGVDSSTCIANIQNVLAAMAEATDGTIDTAALMTAALSIGGVSSVASIGSSQFSASNPRMIAQSVRVAVSTIT